jgi:hypothetical protein
MQARTALLPLAVIGLALLPATASASTGAAAPAAGKRAHATGDGGGAPPVLPTAVRVRIKRGENALDRAADYVDRDLPDKAAASLKNARRNMYAAWRSAAYIVENAPPPAPPADDKAVAHGAGAAPSGAGTTYAAPEDTAVAVLSYQHDVVGTSFGLLDGAKGSLRDQVSTTLFSALDRRDAAVAFIHARPVPPPPPADKAVAHAADAPAVTGFPALMPAVVPDLDDELLQSRELTKGGALTSGEKRIVLLARDQIGSTKDDIASFWPPVVAGD